MNLIDRQIIEDTAAFWLSQGADAEGFVYYWQEILRRIRDHENGDT